MNARTELLLHVLCVCVRLLSRDQAMRLLAIPDKANFKRFVRSLVARGLVAEITVWAKPVPEMREPLKVSEFGKVEVFGDTNDLSMSHVLSLARARWAGVSALPTACIVTTQGAGNLFGVRRVSNLHKPLQASHDLALSEVFITKKAQGIDAQHWHGEDFSTFCFENCRPDAVIVDAQTNPEKIIEVVGADYEEAKIVKLRNYSDARGLSYELW